MAEIAGDIFTQAATYAGKFDGVGKHILLVTKIVDALGKAMTTNTPVEHIEAKWDEARPHLPAVIYTFALRRIAQRYGNHSLTNEDNDIQPKRETAKQFKSRIKGELDNLRKELTQGWRSVGNSAFHIIPEDIRYDKSLTRLYEETAFCVAMSFMKLDDIKSLEQQAGDPGEPRAPAAANEIMVDARMIRPMVRELTHGRAG